MFDVSNTFPAYVIWDGAKSYAVPTGGAVAVGITFAAQSKLTADTVFTVQEAVRVVSEDGTCKPGEFKDVQNIDSCFSQAADGAVKITLAKDTEAGSECRANLLCKPEFYIKLVAKEGGDAKNITAAATLQL